MSSLFATVQAAEEFLQNGNDESASTAYVLAQNIISQHWPKSGAMTASENRYIQRRLRNVRHFAKRAVRIAKSALRRLSKP